MRQPKSHRTLCREPWDGVYCPSCGHGVNPAATEVGNAEKRKAEAVLVKYTNYRGEARARRIRPVHLFFGICPPYHPEPQWLLACDDLDKGEERTFAMSGIREWLK